MADVPVLRDAGRAAAGDLDAALTAEAKIALVDDTIPLVPQAEPRVADA